MATKNRRHLFKILSASLLLATTCSMHGQTTIFLDRFNGPTMNPLWVGALPNVPLANGIGPESYVGLPNYRFQSLNGNSTLHLNTLLSDLQRVGWKLDTNFYTSDFRYEVRFNTLTQSSSTSIDAFIEIWILDAANSNRYDIVSLFGGAYGDDRRVLADSSISGSAFDQPFVYQDNTWYRFVLSGSTIQNMRASLCDDQDNELAGFDLGHDTTSFSSGYTIALSQGMGQPQGTYPTDVAVDYALISTTNKVSTVPATSTRGVQVSWQSEPGRWYQVQLPGPGDKWVNFGKPIQGTDTNSSVFIPDQKAEKHYRVQLLP